MATLLSLNSPHTNLSINNFNCKLRDNVIIPGSIMEIKNVQKTENTDDDRQTSSRLNTSIGRQDVGSSVRPNVTLLRPKTAMAALGIPDIKNVSGPYQTTYQREFTKKAFTGTSRYTYDAIRPSTSNGQRASIVKMPEPVRHLSQYSMEFLEKDQPPNSLIWTGSSSGNRANNPHPCKEFMVRRIPSKNATKPTSTSSSSTPSISETLSREKLHHIAQRLCRSVYQNDFLGIPQGFKMSLYDDLRPDWKEEVPHTLNSLHRSSFRSPVQQPEHRLPVSRYGSNLKKHIPSVGVIPTANLRALINKTRTTYDQCINDKAFVVMQHANNFNRLEICNRLRRQHQRPFAADSQNKSTIRANTAENAVTTKLDDELCAMSITQENTSHPALIDQDHRRNITKETAVTDYSEPLTLSNFHCRQVNDPVFPVSPMSLIYSPPLLLN